MNDIKTIIHLLRDAHRPADLAKLMDDAADCLERLTKPQWYSDDDGDVGGDWDYVADWHSLEPGKLLHLYGARHVSEAYVANVPVPDEDDGKYELFPTREEAEKAIAEALK